jgi:hypothetical protein
LWDYYDWIRVGIALKSEEDDSLLELWDEASRRAEDVYEEGCCERKWQTFDRTYREEAKKLHLDSIFYWAWEDSGWRPDNLIGEVKLGVFQPPPPKPAHLDWPELLPLAPSDSYGPPFPTEVLSPWAREWAERTAVSYQVPVCLPASLCLGLTNAAIAGKTVVTIRPGWVEQLNLYLAAALLTGERKSAVHAAALAPVRRAERTMMDRLQNEVAFSVAFKRALESHEKRCINALSRCNDSFKQPKLKEDLEKASAALASYKEVVKPRFCCDDATPEALKLLLADHGKMLQCGTEGTVFEQAKGKYSKPGVTNFEVYLEAYTGDPITVDRVNRTPIIIEHPALSICMAVQPDVLRGLMDNKAMAPRGYLARFLYVTPKSKVGTRVIGAPGVPKNVTDEYDERMHTMWIHASVPMLTFSAEAREAMEEFERWIEPQLGTGGGLSGMAGWANKLAGAAARIAGGMHVADGETGDTVGVKVVERAIRLAKNYFLLHAAITFASMQISEVVSVALAVVTALPKLTKDGIVSRRDIHRILGSRIQDSSGLDPVLVLLVEYGYLKPTHSGQRAGRGHASPTYYVHPDIEVS